LMRSKYERDLRRSGRERRNRRVRCAVCGEPITGRLWRVGNGKWACTRCANEV